MIVYTEHKAPTGAPWPMLSASEMMIKANMSINEEMNIQMNISPDRISNGNMNSEIVTNTTPRINYEDIVKLFASIFEAHFFTQIFLIVKLKGATKVIRIAIIGFIYPSFWFSLSLDL